jgi:Protein of unknown function (DUF3987)/Domain of unknown function (DUF3854)
MSATPKPKLLRLLSNHRADLELSGLNERTLATWGAYSIEADQKWVMVQLGFGHIEPPALALPILPPDLIRPDLDYVMLKPDCPRRDKRGHAAKYEARSKSRNRIHVPLTVRDQLSDVAAPLVVTEGQKKAEKAAQEGICAIALAGVWNWRDRIGESSFPISDLELFPLGGRRIYLCFDSDAALNTHVRRAESDLAAFLKKRFSAHVSVMRIPPREDGNKVGLDDFLLANTPEKFWHIPLQESSALTFSTPDWPDPALLPDELPPVESFALDFLPASFRPLIEDVSELMQTPADFAAAAAVTALAGCVNRRASIQPKANDVSWTVIPNLWGANIGLPGYMKSPVLRAITHPLSHIEEMWRAEYSQESAEYDSAKEETELRHQAWRETSKRAMKKGEPVRMQPDQSVSPPVQKRLVLTDSTFEMLHVILSKNSAGVLFIRDELPGWLAQLDRQGREGERGFFLQAWNGDAGFTIDRIGRGSTHVPAVCVSLFGNIQPNRLRWYLSDALEGGPRDDGLIQRFQILVWPDSPEPYRLVDRPPNAAASAAAEAVYSRLANLSADNPIRLRFCVDAQSLFYEWLEDLEMKVRRPFGLHPALVAHLSKYRSLMPTLAGLFELADLAAIGGEFSYEVSISLDHTRQAAAYCGYLESHAGRVYSCITSPECRASRDLARHIQAGDVAPVFHTRDIYLKGWVGLDTVERANAALELLTHIAWVRQPQFDHRQVGRPPDVWEINPKVQRVDHGEKAI